MRSGLSRVQEALPGSFHFVANILGRIGGNELLELPDEASSAQAQFRVTAAYRPLGDVTTIVGR